MSAQKPAKPQRSDGVDARMRLLDAALALFAEQGFAKTSTREIALAAQVNIASISYYFGDKAGLYRAVWSDTRFNPHAAMLLQSQTAGTRTQAQAHSQARTQDHSHSGAARAAQGAQATPATPATPATRTAAARSAVDAALPPNTLSASGAPSAPSMRELLQGLFSGFVEPLKQGDVTRQCLKLHFREMIEPSGLWKEEIDTQIKPMHTLLVAAICAYLHVTRPDHETYRLAFAITGMGVMLHVGADVLDALRPQLVATHKALDLHQARLVDYGMALLDAEAVRRATKKEALGGGFISTAAALKQKLKQQIK